MSISREWSDKNKGIITSIFQPGEWFRFPRKLLSIMSANEALMLCELLNESTLMRAGISDDGWFKYSVKDFEDRMFMSEHAQRRALDNLVGLGIVERGLCQDTRVRLFRIHYDIIHDILNSDVNNCAPSESASYTVVHLAKAQAPTLRKRKHPPCESAGSTIICRSKENNRTTSQRRSASSDSSLANKGFNFDGEKQPPKEKCGCQLAAEKLYNRLLEKGLVNKKRSNVSKWSKTIREFLTDNEYVTKKEFQQTLIWYMKHIGEEFIPEALSAEGFCGKYAQIKLAKIRQERANGFIPPNRSRCSNQAAVEECLRMRKERAEKAVEVIDQPPPREEWILPEINKMRYFERD